MKIRCPQCLRVSEIPHVDHGRIAVCACKATFKIDDSTVVEELSLPDLPPPEFIGRYSIVRYLGRGALNCVYEGIHPDLGIPVAVKTLLPEYASDKPSRDQFLHAAKIYVKAVHPNIVKVFEAGKDANGVPFLAMEFLSGGTLADRIQKNGVFSAEEAARIGAEVCRALVVTAGLGIVHRDIKPDNIMLSSDGKYKLTDLGLAKLDASSAAGNGALVLDENAPDKSIRKTSFGTLEYMSPEQYIDTESCDIRSDIYSLGVTMYQLAAGRLPFETQTRTELRHMHISVEPLVPSAYVHGIPIDFDYITMRCIQKKPEDRYGTPEELLADLEAFLAGAVLPSTSCGAVPYVRPPVLPSSPVPKNDKRITFLPVTAAVLCLLILTFAGLLILKECSSSSRNKQLSAPMEASVDAGEDNIFIGRSSSDSFVSNLNSSRKMLDAEVDDGEGKIEMPPLDRDLFSGIVQDAQKALETGSGFRKAIDDLSNFESYEECAEEVRSLRDQLADASGKAVKKLMESLDRKAEQLIAEGHYDAAISVYDIDVEIEPLKQESMEARGKRKLEIEEMRRNAGRDASLPESGESPTKEESRP